jgi:hypothetical protein
LIWQRLRGGRLGRVTVDDIVASEHDDQRFFATFRPMSDQTERYSRLTYLAYGEFPDDQRALVQEQCAQFHAALQADREPEQAAEAFPTNARAEAVRAAKTIRAFETAIGEKTGAFPSQVYRPEMQPWWPNWPDTPKYTVGSFCVGIQVHFVGSFAARDAAIAAADALADLLRALGATDVASDWMD